MINITVQEYYISQPFVTVPLRNDCVFYCLIVGEGRSLKEWSNLPYSNNTTRAEPIGCSSYVVHYIFIPDRAAANRMPKGSFGFALPQTCREARKLKPALK